jgi:hypothetical protein
MHTGSARADPVFIFWGAKFRAALGDPPYISDEWDEVQIVPCPLPGFPMGIRFPS